MTDKLCCPKCGSLLHRGYVDRLGIGDYVEVLECRTCGVYMDESMADKVSDDPAPTA